ncbi:MAG: hypothetical protein ABSB40_10115 [Nitrososphaeria archaeon]
MKAVRSCLSFNDRDLKTRPKIRGVQETPSLKDERVPTKDELRKIFLSGDKRGRTTSVLIAQIGTFKRILTLTED